MKVEDSYIKDYIINLLENTFNDDYDRLKALKFGIEYILENIKNVIENEFDEENFDKLAYSLKLINEVVKCYEIPLF